MESLAEKILDWSTFFQFVKMNILTNPDKRMSIKVPVEMLRNPVSPHMIKLN